MNGSTRRRFLAAAGLGTAGVVAATVGGAPAAGAAEEHAAEHHAAEHHAAEHHTLPADAQGAMAAYIHDVRRGEVALLIEGREVVITDKRLVARLASAFARAGRI